MISNTLRASTTMVMPKSVDDEPVARQVSDSFAPALGYLCDCAQIVQASDRTKLVEAHVSTKRDSPTKIGPGSQAKSP